jgi:hypothetical protein
MGTYGRVTGVSGLASTGAVVGVGGHFFGLLAMLMIAVVLVSVGAIFLRLGWRRDRPLNGR